MLAAQFFFFVFSWCFWVIICICIVITLEFCSHNCLPLMFPHTHTRRAECRINDNMGYNAIIAIILQLTSRAASANPFPWSANRIESARKTLKEKTIFSIFVFVLLLVCVSFGSFIHSLFSIVYSLGRNRKRGDNAMELLAAKCFFFLWVHFNFIMCADYIAKEYRQ